MNTIKPTRAEYIRARTRDIYDDVVACDIRIHTFRDENSHTWKEAKFGQEQRHFMSLPLKQAQ